MTIIHDLVKEQQRGYDKYGAKDDTVTAIEWASYITRYIVAATITDDKKCRRDLLVKAGGLIISAIKALDRNGEFPTRDKDKE